jgi:D-amino-acid oxidase
VIGAGVVGLSIAWLLQRQGHAVNLVDPALAGPAPTESGSAAALGLLMAQVYRRRSGRGWRLRQQSLSLWEAWRIELAARGRPVPWRAGLLQLAATEQDLENQRRLVHERQAMGLPLRLLSRAELQELQPAAPAAALGGLLSPNEARSIRFRQWPLCGPMARRTACRKRPQQQQRSNAIRAEGPGGAGACSWWTARRWTPTGWC